MKKSSLFLIAALGIIALGCNSQPPTDTPGTSDQSSSTKAPEGKKLRIAVIPKGNTHEFWKAIHAGADKAAAEFGVEVIWKGPQKEDDRDDQIKVVEDFTTQKVDGIVLAPLDDTALRIPVKSAQDAGIPVLIIDSGLKEIETVSFVATDNYQAGMRGGEKMVELLGTAPKKLILLRYQEGSASTTERENGYLDALKKAPNITVVSAERYAGPTTETAFAESENLRQRFKDVDAVLCPNESSTAGMLRALQQAGLAGKVFFVGFDSSSKLIEGLKAKEINALVVQNPIQMGYLGVKNMVAHLKKESVEKRVDTGAAVVTLENIETPEIAPLVAPPSK